MTQTRPKHPPDLAARIGASTYSASEPGFAARCCPGPGPQCNGSRPSTTRTDFEPKHRSPHRTRRGRAPRTAVRPGGVRASGRRRGRSLHAPRGRVGARSVAHQRRPPFPTASGASGAPSSPSTAPDILASRARHRSVQDADVHPRRASSRRRGVCRHAKNNTPLA
jgi:hypothetical protein